jgi:hypothetical protein
MKIRYYFLAWWHLLLGHKHIANDYIFIGDHL